MKWLKSTSDKEYTACGHIIPAVFKEPIAVNEADYKKITDMAVIKSLIATGGIIALDHYTSQNVTGDAAKQKLQVLTTENARLSDRIRELEAQSAASDAKAVSAKKLKSAEDRATNAEHALAALQAKYEALEKEANEKIAELSKDAE